MTAPCPDCARKATQVASLAHTAAVLRAELARARESERATNESCIHVLTQTHRGWLRRERLARWAGAVAADTRDAAWLECLNLTGASVVRALRDRDRYRAVVEAGVAELARTWRST